MALDQKQAFNILNFGLEKVSALIAEGNVEALIEIPYLNPQNGKTDCGWITG